MKNTICYSISYTVECLILWQYASKLFIHRNNKKWSIPLLISSFIFLLLFSLFENHWLNGCLFLSVTFLFLLTQFEIKWYIALFHSAIMTALMGTSELILYGLLLPFSPNFFENTLYFHNLLILTVFSKIIYFLISYFLILLFKGTSKNRVQNDKIVAILILIPIASIFVMLTLVNVGEIVPIGSSVSWMVTISALFMLAIDLLVFSMNQYTQIKNQEYTEMQIMLQREYDSTEYYKMLIQQNENQNILIHDIKKHLQSIALLNDTNDREKIATYINHIVQFSNLKDSVHFCDHELLNAILCRYKRKCQELDITFHTDIRSNTVEFMEDSDLTSLFGNLLDNALEAASKMPNSYIDINVLKRENTPFTVLTMINSCRVEPTFDSQNHLLTHKPDKLRHGYGIKSVWRIIQKYDGNMQVYFDEETKIFHTIILLKS